MPNSDTVASDVTPATDREDNPPSSNKNAWARISATVREVDAGKVKDCQDDIDSILVFAGLYSAVLTAFLVESQKDLQQDPQDLMVFLLQQLIVQTNSFVINDGFVNSSLTQPMLVKTFTPSLNAQRVNTLWFASLTVSLMSASFSIVVKQWLRESLAMEQSSPRAHLRIRHFRIPGLHRYMVFEIASFLPLLLQISLLLFFVGLCFFTVNIHESIGTTTLSLVAAWAFFMIATTLAPIADPICPYKVPILKTPIKALRRHLLNLNPCRRRSGGQPAPAHGDPNEGLVKPEELDVHHNEAASTTSSQMQSAQYSTHSADTASESQASILSQADTEPHGIEAISRRERAIVPEVTESTGTYASHATDDEDTIAHDEHNDVDVLVHVLRIDAVQADDQLLKDITSEALQQASIQPEELYRLPFAVIDARLKPGMAKRLEKEFIGMESLSRQTYATITYMLALLVEEAMKDKTVVGRLADLSTPRQGREQRELRWLGASICALLSNARFKHNPVVNQALYACLTQGRYQHLSRLLLRVIRGHPRADWPFIVSTVLERLHGGLAEEKSMENLLTMLHHLLEQLRPIISISQSSLAISGPNGQIDPMCPPSYKPLLRTLLLQRIQADSSINAENLVRVDAILVDDELLRETIWQALLRAKVEPARLSKFIVEAISNRISRDISTEIRRTFLDLTGDRYAAIIEIASQFVVEETTKRPQPVQGITKHTDPALGDVICILLSKWDNPDVSVLRIVNQALGACLSDAYYLYTADLISKRKSGSPDSVRCALSRLEEGFKEVADDFSVRLIEFVQHVFPPTLPKDDLIKSKPEGRRAQFPTLCIDADFAVIYNVADDYREAVSDLFLAKIQAPKALDKEQLDNGYKLLFEGVFQLCHNSAATQTSYTRKIVKFVRQLMGATEAGKSSESRGTRDSNSKGADVICGIVLNTKSHPKVVRATAQQVLLKAVSEGGIDAEGLSQILLTLVNYSRRRPDNALQPSQLSSTLATLETLVVSRSSAVDSFTTLHFYLRLINKFPHVSHDKAHIPYWQQLFEPIFSSLKQLSSDLANSSSNLDMDAAEDCLELVDKIKSTFADRPHLKLPFQATELERLLEKIRDSGTSGAQTQAEWIRANLPSRVVHRQP